MTRGITFGTDSPAYSRIIATYQSNVTEDKKAWHAANRVNPLSVQPATHREPINNAHRQQGKDGRINPARLDRGLVYKVVVKVVFATAQHAIHSKVWFDDTTVILGSSR